MNRDSTATLSRRERRSAELHGRIVRAAVALFAQKGFAATTVEDITTAADVGKGTFFNYFATKEHLLAAFGQMQIRKVQAAADAAATTTLPIRDYLYKLALDVASEPARNPTVIRALLQANLSIQPVRDVMRQIHARATALLGQIITVGQGRGEIRNDISANDIAQGLRQSLLGAMLIWSLYGDGSLQDRIQTTLQILWDGLSPRPDSSSSTPSSRQGITP